MTDAIQTSQDKLLPAAVLSNKEQLSEDFQIPKRPWEVLISSYNSKNKRKFPFTALQCSAIIEWTKMGIYPKSIFKACGKESMYGRWKTTALDMEERLEILNTKDTLSAEEFEEFQNIIRNPLRILMSDISRAEGLSELVLWNLFNEKAITQPELLMAAMKAKFKEVFSEKNADASNLNVQILVGGDWAEKL